MEGFSAARDAPGDFSTPEQQVPGRGLPGVDWETCLTMNDNWGYNRADQNWKSVRTLIRTLVDVVSKGGNLLLNVGPTSEGLIPACDEKGLWGHIDTSGREVVSPRFPGDFGEGWQSGYRFSRGLALFELRDGSAIAINREGETLWTLPKGSFDRLGDLMPNGLIWFEQNWKHGLLNAQGEVVVPARYRLPSEGMGYQEDFALGRQAVEQNGLWGYLDDQGQLLIPLRFQSARNFQQGLARVYRDGKLCYIDREGEVVWQEK